MWKLFTVIMAAATCLDVIMTSVAAQACSKVTIFNAGLLHRAKKYKEREPLIPGALLAHDADFYCLQEVWLEADMERLIEQVKDKYPYHYSGIHHGQNQLRKPEERVSFFRNPFKAIKNILPKISSPCSMGDILVGMVKVLNCAKKTDCTKTSSDSTELGACTAKLCGDVIKSSMSQTCYQCYILMSSSKLDFVEACAPDVFERKNRFNPAGLLVLSKQPMKNVVYSKFWPGKRQAMERGYIQADVPGVGKTICTHMSQAKPYSLEYDDLPKKTFEEQQAAEMLRLIDRFGTVDHLLMGDLNFGPSRLNPSDPEKNLTAEGHNWDIISVSDYQAPYFQQDGRCTYCKNNPISGTSINKGIDHILVNGDAVSIPRIERVLDTDQPALSDHYGIQAEVCEGPNL